MQEEFLKMKDKTVLGIGSVDDALKIFPAHHNDYVPRRVAKKIHSRFIYTSQQGPFLKESDPDLFRDARYVPPDQFNFRSDITIFDDKVAIASLSGKLSGVIISHSEIANSFRGLFEFLWSKI